MFSFLLRSSLLPIFFPFLNILPHLLGPLSLVSDVISLDSLRERSRGGFSFEI
jgi:hypothetical protein